MSEIKNDKNGMQYAIIDKNDGFPGKFLEKSMLNLNMVPYTNFMLNELLRAFMGNPEYTAFNCSETNVSDYLELNMTNMTQTLDPVLIKWNTKFVQVMENLQLENVPTNSVVYLDVQFENQVIELKAIQVDSAVIDDIYNATDKSDEARRKQRGIVETTLTNNHPGATTDEFAIIPIAIMTSTDRTPQTFEFLSDLQTMMDSTNN